MSEKKSLREIIFYTLILKQRTHLMNKSKRKIEKYTRKLDVETNLYDWLKRDTKNLILNGTYKNCKEEPLELEDDIHHPKIINKIDLTYVVYSRTKPYLSSEECGKKVYEIISDRIDYDKMNVIKFPDNIKNVSISFCNGFYEGILKNIKRDEFDKYFTIEGNEELVTKFKKYLFI